MSLLDTASFFAKSLIPTIGGRGSNRRVPFTFTSTKRLLASGALDTANSRDLAKADAQDVLTKELKAIEGTDTLGSVLGTLGLSSILSVVPSMPVISMAVNPNTIKWNQPKRFNKRDTMNGSVFFHFTNQNGQNNDILTLNFTGNTGNINTQNGLDASTATGADVKLRIWHELYALTREPVLLDGGVKNEFFITYRTVLLPIPVTFIGFFNQVLEFTENAKDPFSRDYNFGFTVTNTSPPLDDLTNKLNSALSLVGPISAVRSVKI